MAKYQPSVFRHGDLVVTVTGNSAEGYDVLVEAENATEHDQIPVTVSWAGVEQLTAGI